MIRDNKITAEPTLVEKLAVAQQAEYQARQALLEALQGKSLDDKVILAERLLNTNATLKPLLREANKDKINVFQNRIKTAIEAMIANSDWEDLTGEPIKSVLWTIQQDAGEPLTTLSINTVAVPASPILTERPLPSTPVSVNRTPMKTVRTHFRIGARLLREHDLSARKGYFSKDGVPYQKPEQFPAVLFDPKGYLIVNDDDSMRRNPYINVGKQVSVPRGIYSVPGYVACGHEHD